MQHCKSHLFLSGLLRQPALPSLLLTLRLPSSLPRRKQPLLLGLQLVGRLSGCTCDQQCLREA